MYRVDTLFLHIRPGDSVGIQTQDLQNRNLTLYSAKLRDLIHFADAKVIIFYQDSKDDKPKSKIEPTSSFN